MTLMDENDPPDIGAKAPAVAPKKASFIRIPKQAPVNAKTADTPTKKVVTTKAGEKRQISSIGFPYVDLDTIVAMARAMHVAGGLALTRDQLAGALGQSPGSGSFMLKLGAARLFGVIEQTTAGRQQLTNLGFAIASKDEGEAASARAAAFLHVPLFRKTYEEYRGKPLPPRPHGLNAAFVQFGVAPKQKDNARQIFEKSARQAGFYSVDPNRLIEPISGGLPVITGRAEIISEPSKLEAHGTTIPMLDRLIQGLVDRLPEPGTVWEPEKRARWLQTLAANFDMVYESENGNRVVVEVKKGDIFE